MVIYTIVISAMLAAAAVTGVVFTIRLWRAWRQGHALLALVLACAALTVLALCAQALLLLGQPGDVAIWLSGAAVALLLAFRLIWRARAELFNPPDHSRPLV